MKIRCVVVTVRSPCVLSISFLSSFRLVLDPETVVRGVEGLQSDVAVLAAGRVVVAVGGECEGVDGAEVTLDAAELLLEDEVVETRVELADLGRGGCDLHGILATTQNHLEETDIF